MQTVELTSQKRDISNKGALRTLRVDGQIPAVIYGSKKEAIHAAVNAKEFAKILKAHGRNVLVQLKTDGGLETALVQEVQRDIITHHPIHVDFRRVSLTEKLEVSVPLLVKGEAPGVKTQGGILETILHDLRVRCVVTDIPTHIDVDVSALAINNGIKVKDIKLPAGVEVLADGERLVVNIVAPSELKEETPAAAPVAGAAEPEVIAKGKKPEEGAEGAAAPAAGAKGAAPAAGGKDAKGAPAAKEGGKK